MQHKKVGWQLPKGEVCWHSMLSWCNYPLHVTYLNIISHANFFKNVPKTKSKYVVRKFMVSASKSEPCIKQIVHKTERLFLHSYYCHPEICRKLLNWEIMSSVITLFNKWLCTGPRYGIATVATKELVNKCRYFFVVFRISFLKKHFHFF